MQFRLRTPHVIEGAYRPIGTIVGPYGSGAPVVLSGPPTLDMEGIDDEGIAEVNKLHQLMNHADAPWHREDSPTVEKPYVDEHPDNQPVDQEAQDKANAEMWEQSQKFHRPQEPLNISGAVSPMTRPIQAVTPQDQAFAPDRPLGQQLPNVHDAAASSSPAAEAAKKVESNRAPPAASVRSVPRAARKDDDDEV